MKTPTNTARDLMLLSMIAHSNKKYDTAGSLFSAALASSDVEDLVNALQTMTDEPGTSQSADLSFDPHSDDSMSLSAIAAVLAAAMEEEDETQEEDAEDSGEADDADADDSSEEEDAVEEEDETEEDSGEAEAEADDEADDADADEEEVEEEEPVDSTAEDDDGDDSTDDLDPDSPGDTLLPSSISAVSDLEIDENSPASAVTASTTKFVRRLRPSIEADSTPAGSALTADSGYIPVRGNSAPVRSTEGTRFLAALPKGRSPVSVRSGP